MNLTLKAITLPVLALVVGALLASPASAATHSHHKMTHHRTRHHITARRHSTAIRRAAMVQPPVAIHHKAQPMRPVPPPRPPLSVAPAVP